MRLASDILYRDYFEKPKAYFELAKTSFEPQAISSFLGFDHSFDVAILFYAFCFHFIWNSAPSNIFNESFNQFGLKKISYSSFKKTNKQ